MGKHRKQLYATISQRLVIKGERYMVLDTSKDCYLVETDGHAQWMLMDYFTNDKPPMNL